MNIQTFTGLLTIAIGYYIIMRYMPNRAEALGYLRSREARERSAIAYLTMQEDVTHSVQAKTVATGVRELLRIVSGETPDEAKRGIVMSTRMYDFWDALESHATGIPHIRLTPGKDGEFSFTLDPLTGKLDVPEEYRMTAEQITTQQDRNPDEIVLVASQPEFQLIHGSTVSLSLFQSAGIPNEFCITMTRMYAAPIRRGMNTIAADIRSYRVGQDGTVTSGVRGTTEQFYPSVFGLADKLVAQESGAAAWRGLSVSELVASVQAYKMLGERHGFITSA